MSLIQKNIKEEYIESPFHTRTPENDKIKSIDISRGMSLIIEEYVKPNPKPKIEKKCCSIS